MFGSHSVPNNLSHPLDLRFEPQVFRSALYSLSTNIWGFSHILLLAMSTLSPLWSETITHMIWICLNFLRLVAWPTIRSVLGTVPCTLQNHVLRSNMFLNIALLCLCTFYWHEDCFFSVFLFLLLIITIMLPWSPTRCRRLGLLSNVGALTIQKNKYLCF